MKHLFFILPAAPLDWLLLVIFAVMAIVFYFNSPVKEKEEKSLSLKWLLPLILLGAPIINILIELSVFGDQPFRSPAQDITIVLRLCTIGLPISLVVRFFEYRKAFRWVLLLGFFYGILISHSMFFIIEVVFVYVVAVRIFSIATLKKQPLFSFALVMVAIAPIIFTISLAQFSEELVVRLDYALTIGWFRWLAYAVSFFLATMLFAWVTHGQEEPLQETFPFALGSVEFSLSKRTCFLGVLFLFFITSSILWAWQRTHFIQSTSDMTEQLFESFAEDYYYFLDEGKALIQFNVAEYPSSPEFNYDNLLRTHINRIPYFQSMGVFVNQRLVASYPDGADDFSTVGDLCPGAQGTSAMLRLYPLEESTHYYFSAQNDADVCLVGITSIEFSPQLNQYIHLLNRYSTNWQITDPLGVIYTWGTLQGIDSSAFYVNGFTRTLTINMDPVELIFFHQLSLSSIASAIYQKSVPWLLGSFIFHFLILILIINWAKSVHQQTQSLDTNLKLLADLKFEDVLEIGNAENWYGMNEELHRIASLMELQNTFAVNGYRVLGRLGEITTLREIKALLQTESFLRELGKFSLFLDPELRNVQSITPNSPFTYHYQTFVDKANQNELNPFMIANIKSGQATQIPSTFFYPLHIEEQIFGFLVMIPKDQHEISSEIHQYVKAMASLVMNSIYQQVKRVENVNDIDRIRLLVQAFPDPLFLFDAQHRVVMVNDAAKQLPGVIGERVEEGVSLQDIVLDSELLEIIEKASQEKALSNFHHRNNHVYLVKAMKSTIGNSGSGMWVLVALQDITSYRDQEQVRAELFETVAQYLQMPIKMTRGNLKMLSMVGVLNDSQKTYSENMEANINDIDAFIRQMLERNRLENPASYDLKQVDLRDIFFDVNDRIAPIIDQQHVTLCFDSEKSEDPRLVMIDQQLFTQAVFSLVENAVYHSPIGEMVKVTVSEEEMSYVVCISDRGPGISAVDLERVFLDPIVLELQGESPRISMGVQLAKSIIERQHGTIWVKSKLGEGSQFYIKIPKVSEKNQ